MWGFAGITNSYYSIDDIPDNNHIIIINNKPKRNLFNRLILILTIGIICIFILMIILTEIMITFKHKSINLYYQNSSLDHNKIILNISKPLKQNNSLNCLLPINPNYTKNGDIVAGGFSSSIDESDKLQGPTSVYLDHERNIYVADTTNHRIRKYSPGDSDEGETLIDKTSNINSPCCLYIDQESNYLYFLDQDNQRNYRVQFIQLNSNSLKSLILLVGYQTISYGMKLDQNFNIYVSEFNHHRIVK
ncbi:hypothetical protein I4U23_022336 [Adineta vaga]|nr:hypothetical protein I4U23_022336 [Adineta vaga]